MTPGASLCGEMKSERNKEQSTIPQDELKLRH